MATTTMHYIKRQLPSSPLEFYVGGGEWAKEVAPTDPNNHRIRLRLYANEKLAQVTAREENLRVGQEVASVHSAQIEM